MKTTVLISFFVCVFFVVYGTSTAWHSLVTLPHEYSRLRRAGVPGTAYLAGCNVSNGGRGLACRLQMQVDGRVRTWTYPQNERQFAGLQAGAPIPMLADPANLATVFTRADVQAGTNTGVGALSAYGLALVLIGLTGLSFILLVDIRLRKRRRSAAP